MSTIAIYTIDAFADGPFTGNPAAVCPLSKSLPDSVLQQIAMEMNLSETAYLEPCQEGDTFSSGSKFKLRWFTPTMEVPLCGHATLASAAVIFKLLGNQNTRLEFVTRESGSLFSEKAGDLITINLPIDPMDIADDKESKEAAKVVACGFPIIDLQYSPRLEMLLVRLPDTMTRQQFEQLTPDFTSLHQNPRGQWLIITIKGHQGLVDKNGRPYDFASRFFAPGSGVDEDPVTGAAHTVLGAYWSKALGKTEMYARQCSRRGGDIWVRVIGDRVELAGNAIPILKGTITL